jgi:hypothetical protein
MAETMLRRLGQQRQARLVQAYDVDPRALGSTAESTFSGAAPRSTP